MRSSRSDSGRPAFPGPPRTGTDGRVRAVLHGPGWQKVSDGTRAALAEFYDRAADLDDDEFEELLDHFVDTHVDLRNLVNQGELGESDGPRGVDMPAEPDPGAAALPDPFGTPAAAQLPPQPQPQPQPDGSASGNGSGNG
ncbi:hypothetical protein SAMN04487983_1001268 [Streptomyces sp. yr375]|uniref:hypothetical protein n=1 Tax=Streptomyces sp. yr375 TaxID=1761906 RepID=UPI0008B14DE2|nr:hypothetical protein [Streptomyces sp. yr375]SEP68360.1 hypothetical protein SAMN04487983_1001268 [Streptomyces sp. yr375]